MKITVKKIRKEQTNSFINWFTRFLISFKFVNKSHFVQKPNRTFMKKIVSMGCWNKWKKAYKMINWMGCKLGGGGQNSEINKIQEYPHTYTHLFKLWKLPYPGLPPKINKTNGREESKNEKNQLLHRNHINETRNYKKERKKWKVRRKGLSSNKW